MWYTFTLTRPNAAVSMIPHQWTQICWENKWYSMHLSIRTSYMQHGSSNQTDCDIECVVSNVLVGCLVRSRLWWVWEGLWFGKLCNFLIQILFLKWLETYPSMPRFKHSSYVAWITSAVMANIGTCHSLPFFISSFALLFIIRIWHVAWNLQNV